MCQESLYGWQRAARSTTIGSSVVAVNRTPPAALGHEQWRRFVHRSAVLSIGLASENIAASAVKIADL
jgi:hypothetical protein